VKTRLNATSRFSGSKLHYAESLNGCRQGPFSTYLSAMRIAPSQTMPLRNGNISAMETAPSELILFSYLCPAQQLRNFRKWRDIVDEDWDSAIPFLWKRLGEVYSAAGEHAKAIAFYHRAIESTVLLLCDRVVSRNIVAGHVRLKMPPRGNWRILQAAWKFRQSKSELRACPSVLNTERLAYESHRRSETTVRITRREFRLCEFPHSPSAKPSTCAGRSFGLRRGGATSVGEPGNDCVWRVAGRY
jgi:hypothetical protein